MQRESIGIAALGAAVLLAAGCQADKGGSSVETATVQLSVKVVGAGQGFAAADACGNTLTSAQLVMSEIELERSDDLDEEYLDEDEEDEGDVDEGEETGDEEISFTGGEGEGEDDAGDEAETEEEDGDEDDDSDGDGLEEYELELGPYLIELVGGDFNGAIQQNVLSADLPVGLYDEIEFEVHTLDEDDPEDAAAAAADATLADLMSAGLSVRIAGTMSNGNSFVFESSLNEEQEKEIQLVIGDTATGVDGITLTIDPTVWFADGLGGCLDPSDDQNQSEIEENIKASIDLEEDDDGDGESDDVDTDDGDEHEDEDDVDDDEEDEGTT